MATLTDFKEKYMETRGITLIFYMEKKTGKWTARELNTGQAWHADNEFKLFDLLIEFMKTKRKNVKIKYEITND